MKAKNTAKASHDFTAPEPCGYQKLGAQATFILVSMFGIDRFLP